MTKAAKSVTWIAVTALYLILMGCSEEFQQPNYDNVIDVSQSICHDRFMVQSTPVCDYELPPQFDLNGDTLIVKEFGLGKGGCLSSRLSLKEENEKAVIIRPHEMEHCNVTSAFNVTTRFLIGQNAQVAIYINQTTRDTLQIRLRASGKEKHP